MLAHCSAVCAVIVADVAGTPLLLLRLLLLQGFPVPANKADAKQCKRTFCGNHTTSMVVLRPTLCTVFPSRSQCKVGATCGVNKGAYCNSVGCNNDFKPAAYEFCSYAAHNNNGEATIDEVQLKITFTCPAAGTMNFTVNAATSGCGLTNCLQVEGISAAGSPTVLVDFSPADPANQDCSVSRSDRCDGAGAAYRVTEDNGVIYTDSIAGTFMPTAVSGPGPL